MVPVRTLRSFVQRAAPYNEPTIAPSLNAGDGPTFCVSGLDLRMTASASVAALLLSGAVPSKAGPTVRHSRRCNEVPDWLAHGVDGAVHAKRSFHLVPAVERDFVCECYVDIAIGRDGDDVGNGRYAERGAVWESQRLGHGHGPVLARDGQGVRRTPPHRDVEGRRCRMTRNNHRPTTAVSHGLPSPSIGWTSPTTLHPAARWFMGSLRAAYGHAAEHNGILQGMPYAAFSRSVDRRATGQAIPEPAAARGLVDVAVSASVGSVLARGRAHPA